MLNKFARRADRLTLKSFFIADVAGDTTQARAKLALSLSGSTLTALAELLRDAGTLCRITNAELAKNITGLLEYSGHLVEPLAIPDGWETPRCMFNMLVECEGPAGINIEFFVAGFTNRRPERQEGSDDINWNGVDFYVNYITSLRTMHIRTSSGVQPTYSVGQSNLLLADRDARPEFKFNRVRPADVFSTMDALELYHGDNQLIDTRTISTSMGVFSKREHVIPSAWLGDLLRAYGDASMMEALQGPNDGYRNARGIVVEQSASQDPILHAIYQTTGINGSPITLALLRSMFENFDEVSTYVTDDEAEVTYVEGRKEWHTAALLVGHGATALMGSMGLAVVQFYATNTTEGGQPEVVVNQVRPVFGAQMADADLSVLIDAFKTRFLEEIIPQISYNNQQPFQLRVTAHLGGNTQVMIGSGMAGEEMHVRTIASYADSLLTPLVFSMEEDQERLTLVQDIATILSIVPPKESIPGTWGSF